MFRVKNILLVAALGTASLGAMCYELSRSQKEHIKSNNISELMIAVSHGDESQVNQLIKDDPKSVNGHDNDGRTPLMFAVYPEFNGSYGPMKKALVDFAPTSRNEKQLSMMKLLLDNGADIDAEDKEGMTALMHAVTSSQPWVVEFLLARNARIDNKSRNTACGLQPSGRLRLKGEALKNQQERALAVCRILRRAEQETRYASSRDREAEGKTSGAQAETGGMAAGDTPQQTAASSGADSAAASRT